MDSLTQIILGAAVGEAVLGKKVGNRAAMWGAVAGTIPDLDVFSSFIWGEIPSLIIHRGFMHSLVFAIILAPLLGMYTSWFYRQRLYRQQWFKWSLGLLGILLVGFIFYFINLFYNTIAGRWSIIGVLFTVILLLYLGWRMAQNYAMNKSWDINASFKEWTLLFLLSLGTHPILDCFTNYGTRILLPFKSHAVSWNTISVADPAYTIPFGLFLLGALFSRKGSKLRSALNWTGIALSCLYLVFTVYNKSFVDKKFASKFVEQGHSVKRFMTSPTILQNILWYGIAETDSVYLAGYYSLWDKDGEINEIEIIKKNHQALDGHHEDRDVSILKEFSKDYYNIMPLGEDTLQLNDLRFGAFNGDFDDPKSYIFKFELSKDGDTFVGRSIEDREMKVKEAFSDLWKAVVDE